MTEHLDRACELLWQAGHPALAEALDREVRELEARVERLEAVLYPRAVSPAPSAAPGFKATSTREGNEASGEGNDPGTGAAVSPAPSSNNVCVECGMDLTLTEPQIEALRRWGNPVRRQPCLETESGLHRVSPAPSEREWKPGDGWPLPAVSPAPSERSA